MAKIKPVIFTKYGKAEVIVKSVNEKPKKGTVDIMKVPFFGMKKGHPKKSLQDIFVSRITSCEMIIGSRNNKEKQYTKEFINELVLVDVDEQISNLSHELIDKYSMKLKLSIPDALIASTALLGNMKVWSLDLKHLGRI